jgi:transposase
MSSATTSASSVERIEVFSRVQHRRRWTLGEKLRAVKESNVAGMSVSFVARKYGVSPGLLFR